MTLYKWSQNESSNATADSTVNWREGQAPSSINDSARAMMAAVAKWRDDITGILIAGGTSTAYSIVSNQRIAANLDGFTVQFTPGANSGGAMTLSVDGQAPKPLRFRIGVDLPPGVLISGSLYQATFRAASQEWLLHSFDSSVYSIPVGASVEYWGTTAPNGAFVIPNGQAISRTTYATLFNIVGTTYGAGDGSSTFNLPNPAGCAIVQRELASGRLSPAYFGDSTTLGFIGGSDRRSVDQVNLPNVAFSVSNGSLSVTSTVSDIVRSTFGVSSLVGSSGGALGAFASSGGNQTGVITSGGTLTGQTAASGGSGTPLANVQPTIVANRIMRVI